MEQPAQMQRRVISVSGVVQGVGFRPHVYRLALVHGLAGFVRNVGASVHIEVEGACERIDGFVRELDAHAPVLARIDSITSGARCVEGAHGFHIDRSAAHDSGIACPSPDIATCDACLAELRDRADRRHRYPFINCTDCGPRLTIIEGSPYDRSRTTMAQFRMCAECQREYDNPSDRRFHAEPIACPACGPRLRAERERVVLEAEEALGAFIETLRGGGIGAVKGLGGFHLACDASNEDAVARLRARKHRAERPFAVMLADVEAVEDECEVGEGERVLLTSRRAPIVALRRRVMHRVARGVAPGMHTLGVMLPYTPLHHLIMDDLGGIPLVMTSGNVSNEPIAYLDEDAADRLGGIADIILTHDRAIRVRCDDSVTRFVRGAEFPMRRSRGEAPLRVDLGASAKDAILDVGGQQKGTCALAQGGRAYLSHHLGDLEHLQARRGFERDVPLYEDLLGISPRVIAHDLHPDYASTGYAEARAAHEGLRTIGVQHHHAHMVSCMAEHGLDESVIGVTFDGTGYGLDGTIWGGEFLVGDRGSFERAAHLRCVGMPGGERAVREPWRMAASHLIDAGIDPERVMPDVSPGALGAIRRMLERGFNTPRTSSAGRLFDAVAGILGSSHHTTYEGQAAIELEQHALEALHAAIALNGHATPGARLAVTTDSFVVQPLFFPGGDIGSLAVHGTINDLAVGGAEPLFLTAGFILEEGLPMADLERIVRSMRSACDGSGVLLVAGDTKVVDKGKGDGVYINTTGVGIVPPGRALSIHAARAGDRIICSGTIGDHGIAIMSVREGIEFETPLESDSAALNGLTRTMLEVCPSIRTMRDPTRGGVSSVLNELASACGVGVVIDEAAIPMRAEVRGACEMLGLDPLYVANEGKLLAVVPAEAADEVLRAMREHPLGREAAIVGEVVDDHQGMVVLRSLIGGKRVVTMLAGEQLPRIC